MRKATSRKIEPSRASLRELPEVNVRAFTVHRNRFAARVAKEGIHVVHDGPGRSSLAEIPEIDLGSARLRKNPFAKRVDASALQMHVRRGRPAPGDEGGPTVARSIRLPLALINALEILAKHEGVTVHALMRMTLANRVRAELLRFTPTGAREGRAAARTNPPSDRGARAYAIPRRKPSR
jgi:hypothetical protein